MNGPRNMTSKSCRWDVCIGIGMSEAKGSPPRDSSLSLNRRQLGSSALHFNRKIRCPKCPPQKMEPDNRRNDESRRWQAKTKMTQRQDPIWERIVHTIYMNVTGEKQKPVRRPPLKPSMTSCPGVFFSILQFRLQGPPLETPGRVICSPISLFASPNKTLKNSELQMIAKRRNIEAKTRVAQ
ncbi:hypothetical protein LY76DRAFT_240779 [Colletotrichum caudatum]|nr:hypothetical protein LY76DRAFT_240779 [Colletotrichum caudatum]